MLTLERAASTVLEMASCQKALGRPNSVSSQDRSFPSPYTPPASKPLLELFFCPLTLLALKSGRPDSPGRQPRGQRPRQTLSLPCYLALAALLRLGGICEHKREDVGIQEDVKYNEAKEE